MMRYQVKKYFEWGSLKLEPSEYLLVEQSEIESCYVITQEKTRKSIIISKEVFQNYSQTFLNSSIL